MRACALRDPSGALPPRVHAKTICSLDAHVGSELPRDAKVDAPRNIFLGGMWGMADTWIVGHFDFHFRIDIMQRDGIVVRRGNVIQAFEIDNQIPILRVLRRGISGTRGEFDPGTVWNGGGIYDARMHSLRHTRFVCL